MIDVESNQIVSIARHMWRRGYWNGYIIGAVSGASVAMMIAALIMRLR